MLSGVRRAGARRRMRREARVRRGSRYSGDEAGREDSRMKPPKRARTTNGSETENAPQARRRDATNSTRVANAARRVADSRAPALRRGGLRRTRPRRQSNDCRALSSVCREAASVCSVVKNRRVLTLSNLSAPSAFLREIKSPKTFANFASNQAQGAGGGSPTALGWKFGRDAEPLRRAVPNR